MEEMKKTVVDKIVQDDNAKLFKKTITNVH